MCPATHFALCLEIPVIQEFASLGEESGNVLSRTERRLRLVASAPAYEAATGACKV